MDRIQKSCACVTIVLEDTFTIYSDNLCLLYICAHVVLCINLLDKAIGNSWQAGNSQIRVFSKLFHLKYFI